MEIEHLGLGAEDRIFVPSPLAHQTGFLYGMWLAMLMGVPQIVQPVWNASRALRALNDWDGTFVQAATPFLADLVAAVEAGERAPAASAHLRCNRRGRAARFSRTRNAHSRHGGLRRVGHDRVVLGIALRTERRTSEGLGNRRARAARNSSAHHRRRGPHAAAGTRRTLRSAVADDVRGLRRSSRLDGGRLYGRRLVSHRRSRRHGRIGIRSHHRTGARRHQSRR